MNFITLLIIGSIIGYLVSNFFPGSSLKLFGNIVFGIIGAIIGHLIHQMLDLNLCSSIIEVIVIEAFGSIIILAILNLIF